MKFPFSLECNQAAPYSFHIYGWFALSAFHLQIVNSHFMPDTLDWEKVGAATLGQTGKYIHKFQLQPGSSTTDFSSH